MIVRKALAGLTGDLLMRAASLSIVLLALMQWSCRDESNGGVLDVQFTDAPAEVVAANGVYDVGVSLTNRAEEPVSVEVLRMGCERETVIGPFTIQGGQRRTAFLSFGTGAPTEAGKVRVWKHESSPESSVKVHLQVP